MDNVQIQMEFPPDLEAVYSNLAVLQASSAEFILDFLLLMPGRSTAKVQARVIMAPAHAKLLLGALAAHLRKFEASNGEVYVPPEVMPGAIVQ